MITKHDAEEALKCYKSPMYFIRHHVKKYDFVMAEYKNLLISKKHREVIAGLIKSDKSAFIVGSRQTGVDMTVLVYLLHELVFNGKSVLLKSNNQMTSKELKNRLLEMISLLPQSWGCTVVEDHNDYVILSSGGKIDMRTNLRGIRMDTDIVYVANAGHVKDLDKFLLDVSAATCYGNPDVRWIMSNSGLPAGDFAKLWESYRGDILRYTIHYSDVEHIPLEKYLDNKRFLPMRSWMEQYELQPCYPAQ